MIFALKELTGQRYRGAPETVKDTFYSFGQGKTKKQQQKNK
jgi:hypothetical protein